MEFACNILNILVDVSLNMLISLLHKTVTTTDNKLVTFLLSDFKMDNDKIQNECFSLYEEDDPAMKDFNYISFKSI